MNTFSTANSQNHYTLENPIKQTKHMVSGVVTNYALILLWIRQNGQGKGFTKKQLVSAALGAVDYKYTDWNWSDAAFCCEFASFNHNNLLTYDKHTRKWYIGGNLQQYLDYHFGPKSKVSFNGWRPYDAAMAYNEIAKQENKEAYDEYQQIKAIGKEFFFQD